MKVSTALMRVNHRGRPDAGEDQAAVSDGGLEPAAVAHRALAQAKGLRRDFEQLVLADPLEALLEIHDARRRQLHALVGVDDRMFVSFFSFVMLTSMSLSRAFSPTI